MNWMAKLEKKLGRYAVPDSYRYLIFAVLIGYGILFLWPEILQFLQFSAPHILHGQIWRLFTWIFVVPSSSNLLLQIIFLFCLMMMGRNLEIFIGTFKMNVYLIGGILISDIGGILVYVFTGLPIVLSTYYILLSMFMLLAVCMPDAEVRIWFVLPVKMKWILVIYIAELAYEIYSYFKAGMLLGSATLGLVYSTQIILAVLNLILFFLLSKPRLSRRQKKRQRDFHAQIRMPRPGYGIAKHRCAVCGRTELDAPDLAFRYCSKCAGNCEYCEEHLFSHQHMRPM